MINMLINNYPSYTVEVGKLYPKFDLVNILWAHKKFSFTIHSSWQPKIFRFSIYVYIFIYYTTRKFLNWREIMEIWICYMWVSHMEAFADQQKSLSQSKRGFDVRKISRENEILKISNLENQVIFSIYQSSQFLTLICGVNQRHRTRQENLWFRMIKTQTYGHQSFPQENFRV